MATTNERLTQWLRDAKAIERQATKMLDTVARHISNYPEVKTQAEQIIHETGRQAAALQNYVEHRGGDPATITPANLTADQQSLSGAFVGTESVKRAMREISSYNILIAAAHAAGDNETRAVCETIRRQEEAMVEWLRKFVGSATEEHLGH